MFHCFIATVQCFTILTAAVQPTGPAGPGLHHRPHGPVSQFGRGEDHYERSHSGPGGVRRAGGGGGQRLGYTARPHNRHQNGTEKGTC